MLFSYIPKRSHFTLQTVFSQHIRIILGLSLFFISDSFQTTSGKDFLLFSFLYFLLPALFDFEPKIILMMANKCKISARDLHLYQEKGRTMHFEVN